jgi:UDP-N-acetylmuramyl pentapeptide synthase
VEFSVPVKVSKLSTSQPKANGILASAGMFTSGRPLAAPGQWSWQVRMRTRLTSSGVRLLSGDNPSDPESVRLALMTLTGVPVAFSRRRWAVLGEMEHSGIDDAADHHAIGCFCAEHFIDRLVCVGSLAMHYAAGALERGMDEESVLTYRAPSQALHALKELVDAGDVALVKGADGMEEITEGMCAD